jgi:hypothetical protein
MKFAQYTVLSKNEEAVYYAYLVTDIPGSNQLMVIVLFCFLGSSTPIDSSIGISNEPPHTLAFSNILIILSTKAHP